MFARLVVVFGLMTAGAGFGMAAHAQSADISPSLIIESGPSDNPEYRRMVFVRYLSGNRVTASYVAYNRTEFRQVPNNISPQIVQNCARGNATSLRDLEAFENAEARRARSGQNPEIVAFCIKGIRNWNGGNKDRYLDRIFNGLPYAATLK